MSGECLSAGRGKGAAVPLWKDEPVHLCVQIPEGQFTALDWLDAALILRAQLAALGVQSSLSRQRLHPDRLNLVLGVDGGWDGEAAAGHRVALVAPQVLMDGPVGSTPVGWRSLHRWPVLPWVPWAQPVASSATEPVHCGVSDVPQPWPYLLHGPERIALLNAASAHSLQTAQAATDAANGTASSLALILALAQGKPVVLTTPLSPGWLHLDAERSTWLARQRACWGQALAEGHLQAAGLLRECMSDLVFYTPEAAAAPVRSQQTLDEAGVAQRALRLLQEGLQVLYSLPPSRGDILLTEGGSTPYRRRLNAAMSLFGYRTGWVNVSNRAEHSPDMDVDSDDDVLANVVRTHGPWDLIEIDEQSMQMASISREGVAGWLASLLAALDPEHGRLVVHLSASQSMSEVTVPRLLSLVQACWRHRHGVAQEAWQVHLGLINDKGYPVATEEQTIQTQVQTPTHRWVLGLRKTEPLERSRLRALCVGFGL